MTSISNIGTYNNLYPYSSGYGSSSYGKNLSSSDQSIFSSMNSSQTSSEFGINMYTDTINNYMNLIKEINQFSEIAKTLPNSGTNGTTGITGTGNLYADNTQNIQNTTGTGNTTGNSNVTTLAFNTSSVAGFYDASNDKAESYNIPEIKKDIPKMWEQYGDLFKKIGAEFGVDPYALAAYCVFESYNSESGTFNTSMYDARGGQYAAGIGATQAQDVNGTKIPGLNKKLSSSIEGAASELRANPEYSIRYLAQEFKENYNQEKDLAKVFPKVAQGQEWRTNSSAYGTKAQYVSRAKVFYDAFKNADATTGLA